MEPKCVDISVSQSQEPKSKNEEKEDGELDSEPECEEISTTNGEEEAAIDKVLESWKETDSKLTQIIVPKKIFSEKEESNAKNHGDENIRSSSKNEEIPTTYRKLANLDRAKEIKRSSSKKSRKSPRPSKASKNSPVLSSKYSPKEKKKITMNELDNKQRVPEKKLENVTIINPVFHTQVKEKEIAEVKVPTIAHELGTDNYEEIGMDIESTSDPTTPMESSSRRHLSISRVDEETLRASLLAQMIRRQNREEQELEEYKARLTSDKNTQAERSTRMQQLNRLVNMKSHQLKDLCRRRDDYIERVRRLVEDVRKAQDEQEHIMMERDQIRVDFEEAQLDICRQENELYNMELMLLERTSGNVEEGNNQPESIDEEVADNVDESSMTKEEKIQKCAMPAEEHDEDELRRLLLQQILNGTKPGQVSPSGEIISETAKDENGMKPSEIEETTVQDTNSEKMACIDETCEIAENSEEMTSSTFCPWELNGICKDSECSYWHNRNLESSLKQSSQLRV